MPMSELGVLQVIQQSLGQQVSMPVAQIVAGFTKVFVGEIVEKGKRRSLFLYHVTNILF
jgi:transcription initiation factor TFIID subunit 11